MVTRMLAYAVEHGTGATPRSPVIQVAGKTGTARIPAPDRPGYLVGRVHRLVHRVPAGRRPAGRGRGDPGPSGRRATAALAAAPLFREVARAAIAQLRIEPGGARPAPTARLPGPMSAGHAGRRERAGDRLTGRGPPPRAHPRATSSPDIPDAEIRGDAGPSRSRTSGTGPTRSTAGSLFFCVPGAHADGHDFAAEAVAHGAGCARRRTMAGPSGPAGSCVPSVRGAMGAGVGGVLRPPGRLDDRWSGSRGRTARRRRRTCWRRSSGRRGGSPGSIGTTGVRIDGRPTPFPRTTPEAPDLHRLFAQMAGRRRRGGRDGGLLARARPAARRRRSVRRAPSSRTCPRTTSTTTSSMERYFEAKARLFTPR